MMLLNVLQRHQTYQVSALHYLLQLYPHNYLYLNVVVVAKPLNIQCPAGLIVNFGHISRQNFNLFRPVGDEYSRKRVRYWESDFPAPKNVSSFDSTPLRQDGCGLHHDISKTCVHICTARQNPFSRCVPGVQQFPLRLTIGRRRIELGNAVHSKQQVYNCFNIPCVDTTAMHMSRRFRDSISDEKCIPIERGLECQPGCSANQNDREFSFSTYQFKR